LAGREQRIPLSQLRILRDLLAPILIHSRRGRNGIKQILMPYRLREKVDRAGFHAFHRRD
jgi:hypothetical protein